MATFYTYGLLSMIRSLQPLQFSAAKHVSPSFFQFLTDHFVPNGFMTYEKLCRFGRCDESVRYCTFSFSCCKRSWYPWLKNFSRSPAFTIWGQNNPFKRSSHGRIPDNTSFILTWTAGIHHNKHSYFLSFWFRLCSYLPFLHEINDIRYHALHTTSTRNPWNSIWW